MIVLFSFSDWLPDDESDDGDDKPRDRQRENRFQERKLIELSAGVGDTRFHKVILLSIRFPLHNEIEQIFLPFFLYLRQGKG